MKLQNLNKSLCQTFTVSTVELKVRVYSILHQIPAFAIQMEVENTNSMKEVKNPNTTANIVVHLLLAFLL